MESIFPIGRHGKTMLSKITTITNRSGVRGIFVQNEYFRRELTSKELIMIRLIFR